jgi:RNA polymerase sigma factor (sigma-70 family)
MAKRHPIPTDAIAEELAPGSLEDDTVSRLTLAGAVERLSDRDRELIALRYGADLTARQIAELLGATTNAVEVSLHRALTRLRTDLDSVPAPAEATSAPRLAEAM